MHTNALKISKNEGSSINIHGSITPTDCHRISKCITIMAAIFRKDTSPVVIMAITMENFHISG